MESTVIAERARLTARAEHRRQAEHRFFTRMAIAAALTVFAGFAPTYFFRSFSSLGPLPSLLHVHGLLFTAWVALFVTQTSLVAAGRTDVHRRLGWVGAALLVVMPIVGVMAAIAAARAGHGPTGVPPLVFLVVPLTDLVVFVPLVAVALFYRRRSDVHKRLMLVAMIGLLTPAIARLPGLGSLGPLGFFGLTDLFLVACVVHDRRTRGQVHPAFTWAALYLIASQPIRLLVGVSPFWLTFATWLTR